MHMYTLKSVTSQLTSETVHTDVTSTLLNRKASAIFTSFLVAEFKKLGFRCQAFAHVLSG